MSERLDLWPHREYDCMEAAGILRNWPDDRAHFEAKITLRSRYHMEGDGDDDDYESDTDDGCLSSHSSICCGGGMEPRSFTVGVVVNEEDHLRFYTVAQRPDAAVLQLMYECLHDLVAHVRAASASPYAFSPRFGYLQACPSNIGTGFKISIRGLTGITSASELRLGYAIDDIINDCLKRYQPEQGSEMTCMCCL